MLHEEEYRDIIAKLKRDFNLSQVEVEEVEYFTFMNKLSLFNIKKAIEAGQVNKLLEFYEYCRKLPLQKTPISFDKWLKGQLPSLSTTEDRTSSPP